MLTASGGESLAQAPRGTPPRAAARPAAKSYQIDVQLHVPPEFDKTQVVEWVGVLRAAGAASASEVSRAPEQRGKRDAQEPPAVRSAGPGRVVVDAAIGSSGNLRIGSEVFRPSDQARLKAFMKKLRDEGPPGADPSAPLWGLDQAQWDALIEALQPASQFDLADKPLDAVLKEVCERTGLRVEFTPAAERAAKQARVRAVTGRVSLGAALAYVLGLSGLAFEPRQDAAGEISLRVLTASEAKRPWPVGLVPERFPGTIAPKLMTTARYQTDDMPLAQVISGLARQLDMELLVDRAALAARKIDPDELRSTVQIPGGTFEAALRKTLAPLGLRHELRIDDASRPFLWITPAEPTSPTPKRKR